MGFELNNVAALLVAVLFALGLFKIVEHARNPLNTIPGPCYAQWTNLRLKVAVMAGQRIHYVHALHQRYGPYVRISPNEIAVNDVQGFKQIHNVQRPFAKSPWYTKFSLTPDTPFLFIMGDPKSHGARRRMFGRAFGKTYLRQHWEGVERQNVELAVTQIQKDISTLGKADMLKWWTFMAVDISAHLMFGETFNTLERGEVNDLLEALQYMNMGGGIAAEVPLAGIIGARLPFRNAQRLFNNAGFMMEYASKAVKNMKASQGQHRNIFATIMAEAEKGEKLEEMDVRAEAIAFIIAGSDTTAVTLTYLVWSVLSRPELKASLVQEVASLPDGYQESHVEELPLLNAIIDETLRLYGAAPGGLPRIVPSGGADIGGYAIPEGITVTTQSYSLHRDSNLFPKPNEFHPSRWLASTSAQDPLKITDAAKTAYNPFGAGSRSCLGINMAYMSLRLATAEFFRRCPEARLAPSATEESMEMENYFLIAPKSHRCEIMA